MSFWATVMHRERDARDWVFVAFVALALAVAGFTGVQRTRYGRAMATLAVCAANADTPCAGRALEEARAIDRDNVRTRIGQAQLRVLLGDPGAAEQALVEVFATESFPVVRKVGTQPLQIDADRIAALDPAVRSELLLVDGDIAAAQAQPDRARSRWTEAALLVDDSLVRPRRERLAHDVAESGARTSAMLRQLRDDFESFFLASESGQLESAQLGARDLRERLKGLSSETARQKLGLAIDASQRAAVVARQRKAEGEPGEAPQPPAPDEQRRNVNAQRYYESRFSDYQRKSARCRDLSATVSTVMTQARTLLDEGLRAAGAVPGQVAPAPSP